MVKYKADFTYKAGGILHIIDVKSKITKKQRDYINKIKILKLDIMHGKYGDAVFIEVV